LDQFDSALAGSIMADKRRAIAAKKLAARRRVYPTRLQRSPRLDDVEVLIPAREIDKRNRLLDGARRGDAAAIRQLWNDYKLKLL